MKALSLIATVFALFLIFMGFTTKQVSGEVLGDTIIIGGVLILILVVTIWILMFIKEKKEKKNREDLGDSE